MKQNIRIKENIRVLKKGDADPQPLRSVLKGAVVSPPPIWLMRQAGRYLPEYRKLRATAGSFLDLCYNPAMASEVTLQPLRRFDFDAAILFSDILVIPDAMGQPVRFVQGEGPRLDALDEGGISRLDTHHVLKRLEPVLETVERVRAALPDNNSLIGFCGAPWTVATYMIAGRGVDDRAPARLFAAEKPDAFTGLIDMLSETSADYLVAQAKAGADVVQVFDSWSGVLGEADFHRWCIVPMRKIVDRLRKEIPHVPIIGFPKGAGLMLERYVAETGVDGVGIDWTVPLGYASAALQPRVAVQGNLDPLTLIAGGEPLEAAVGGILAQMGKGRFIFNLGHGIRPETPIEHVTKLIQLVKTAGGETQADG